MLEPGFYPKRPSKVAHKETHISHVFLTDDLVYKVKKAVRFSFLDYSTLAKRRHFLNEELRLNRRLAPSVYLAVMPISFDATGWRLGGWSAPAEYALVMRRLPERRMLPFLLDSGQLTPEMMRAVAEVLAPFHAGAEPVQKAAAFDYPSNVQKDWAENLNDLQPFFGTWIEDDMFAALKKFGAEFLISITICLSAVSMTAGFAMCMATSTASIFASRRKAFRSLTASNSARSCVPAISPRKSAFS